MVKREIQRSAFYRQTDPSWHLSAPVCGTETITMYHSNKVAVEITGENAGMTRSTHTNPGAACWKDMDGFSLLSESTARSL